MPLQVAALPQSLQKTYSIRVPNKNAPKVVSAIVIFKKQKLKYSVNLQSCGIACGIFWQYRY
jgi:hypothetical protein